MAPKNPEIPEGRCGFELKPADIDLENIEPSEFPKTIRSVCCWREVWQDDRCIWHADVEEKRVEQLLDSWTECDKRLDGAIFRRMDLNEAISFSDSTLIGSTFDNTNLQNTDFSNTTLWSAVFHDSNLKNVSFRNAHLRNAEFDGVLLQNAEFHDADLSDAEFYDTDLPDAEFYDTDLPDAEFHDAYLSGTKFHDAFLPNVEFDGIDLSEAEFHDAFLPQSEFHSASLQNAEFHDANLRYTKFPDANLQRVEFTDANLEHAKLPSSNLIGADLTHANLQDTVLSRTDCRRATFLRTRLYETVFVDTQINSKTTFDESERTSYASLSSRPKCVYEEYDFPSGEIKDTSPLEAAAWVYRRLEHLHEDNALSHVARSYHISKEEAERKALQEVAKESPYQSVGTWKIRGAWCVKTAMRYLSNHGESIRHVLISWAVVILWFWLLFSAGGGIKDSEGNVHWITSIAELTKVSGFRDLFLNLYFSVITFSTIGYGDLAPHGPISRVFVGIESLLGAILTALLIFVLGRRVAR